MELKHQKYCVPDFQATQYVLVLHSAATEWKLNTILSNTDVCLEFRASHICLELQCFNIILHAP